jgi:hypothetical protein
MKALYSNEKTAKKDHKQLKPYNYETRFQALKDGYKFVHLFENEISEKGKMIYKYYSTMNL